MAPSTSRASPLPPDTHEQWAVPTLDAFYRVHARIYDWTRPFILFGRRRTIQELALRPGERVLDVGCGTGWSLPHLCAEGADPIGIECSAAMRRQTERRLEKRRLSHAVTLDATPYGSSDRYARGVDAILFSYSLSMIPPYDAALDRAVRDLRAGGRIAVVDFLDAFGPVGRALRRSHVHLGPARLDALRRRFASHSLSVRSVGLWRFYVFLGRDSSSAAPLSACAWRADRR
jgi:S-adenosylmethionine-diacylgycerolhomoserine-N-methlytransferase